MIYIYLRQTWLFIKKEFNIQELKIFFNNLPSDVKKISSGKI